MGLTRIGLTLLHKITNTIPDKQSSSFSDTESEMTKNGGSQKSGKWLGKSSGCSGSLPESLQAVSQGWDPGATQQALWTRGNTESWNQGDWYSEETATQKGNKENWSLVPVSTWVCWDYWKQDENNPKGFKGAVLALQKGWKESLNPLLWEPLVKVENFIMRRWVDLPHFGE